MTNKRIEKDFLGDMEVPRDAYWGIHTRRAINNFQISGIKVNSRLIRGLATVKKASCLANTENGYLSADKASAITAACEEIIEGKLADQFPIDALQGGAGTSTNMNINEVIANRAIELRGGDKGNYTIIHPLEDVNLHQSTNDVYPTAIKVAGTLALRELAQVIAHLQGAFQEKERAFGEIVKLGRTEWQEAVPITLGAEFSAFAEAFSRDRWRTFKCEERLRVVNLGGTANADSYVEVSGILKAHAVNLIKISSDLRLMNLLGEIRLPQLQAGSSIMPGKVNPVLAEAVIQAGMKVIANDGIITDSAARGTLQINEFLPLLAQAFLESLDLLINMDTLWVKYVNGIAANQKVCGQYFDHSPMIITALLPAIGYERATQLITEFSAGSDKNMRLFLEQKLGKEMVDKYLSPYQLTALGYKDNG